ncbi:MAG: hypothetical protein IT458_01120 [Planctomycetes bacterium]|nr:hypothetical protein [Planctomycetota bacterium]
MSSRGVPLLLVLLSLLSGCASVTLRDVWADPAARDARPQKVIVGAVMPESFSIQIAEDELGRRVGAPEVVPAYRVLSPEQRKDREAAKARIRELGFDGVVVLRVLSDEKELDYVPGTTYPASHFSYGTYHSWYYTGYADPGYYRTVRTLRCAVHVYSVREDKLLFAAITESVNPDDTKQFTAAIAELAAREARRLGFGVLR